MTGEPLKVLVKGPYSGYSGYGNDSFGIVRALQRWGCDVYVQPTWLDVPVPQDLLPLFGKVLRPPFDLLINHWDPGHIKITREAREVARVAVAWTMFEFDAPAPGSVKPCRQHRRECRGTQGRPDCPHCKAPRPSGFEGFEGKVSFTQSTMRERFRWFDLLLGYDEVSVRCLEPFTPRKTAVSVLQGGYDASDWKPADRDWHGDKLGFMMHGQLNSRKQPWLAVEAWHKVKAAHPEFAPAYLSLHTSAPGALFPELNEPFEKSRIRVYVAAWDRPTLQDFYASHHVLLAPSRGEGKNLPALEAATTGAVPCVSAYGGHLQWAGGDWAYLLDGEMAPTFGDKPWAARDFRVSADTLADMFWHIFTHRAEAREKAARAQEIIPKTCDWQVVIANLFRRVRDTVTSNGVGPAVYDKAMRCKVEERAPLAFGGLG